MDLKPKSKRGNGLLRRLFTSQITNKTVFYRTLALTQLRKKMEAFAYSGERRENLFLCFLIRAWKFSSTVPPLLRRWTLPRDDCLRYFLSNFREMMISDFSSFFFFSVFFFFPFLSFPPSALLRFGTSKQWKVQRDRLVEVVVDLGHLSASLHTWCQSWFKKRIFFRWKPIVL